MTDDVVADHDYVPDGARLGSDMTRLRARVGAFLHDGFSLQQVEGFCLAVLGRGAEDAASIGRQTEYELLMLSTTGGAVRSSSGIPVWTQRLSTQARHLVCIVAFDPVVAPDMSGQSRPPVTVPCTHGAAATAADGTCDAVSANGWEFHAADSTLSALDADHERHDACRSPRHAIADHGRTQTRDTSISHRILVSAAWLRDNHAKHISIAEAAAVARMSERNFVRRFKQEIGVVPSEFVRRIRLDEACQMLADSDLPADKIARRTGFSRGTQMARIFRQYLAMSPTEYRHAMRAPRDSAGP
ncbi:AraC family transcriptional regulator [Burkholderia sp. BCC0044]|uniref:helix-turn-helix domain-containing protein n=1 Tax=Burkholderia sp. BCC0044 TaxID=2676295 RepID=UPI00158B22DA|nr:AraC family transcriptional regulator [Burkholderia sp. BCC0044]